MTKYLAIMTNQGAAKLANAAALGTKLNLTHLAVGDGNGVLPTPDPAQTKLVNQKRIAPLNQLSVDPNNASQIIAEQIIPENEGGFWIREIGVYDDDGDLIAVANCPETYKPQLQEGSGRTQTIRMILIVSSTSAVTLKIDPSVVLATRKYADDKVLELKIYTDEKLAKALALKQPLDQTLSDLSGKTVGGILEYLGLENILFQARELLRRSYSEAGYNVVTGSFDLGGTVTTVNDVLINEAEGKAYHWAGSLPKKVNAGGTPDNSGGVGDGLWVDASSALLRGSLAETTGPALIGVPTPELTLDKLLSADDMAIKYGHINTTVTERLSRTGARVVLVGDSLSSFYNIDSVNTASVFESYLRRKVREFNDSAKFYNRAIGGKRYYDLGRDEPALASLTSGYPWYTDISKRWMTYIDEVKPDVIFLAFGMNDGDGWDVGNFQQANFFKMMEELKSISSAPEIVFCTNILPSTSHPDTAEAGKQRGRDAMAGWTRSFARKAGYSCIDLHRRFKCLRDGVDPCMSSYARKTIQKIVALPYVHPTECEMYSARVTLIDPAVAMTGIVFQLSGYTNNILSLKYDPASSRWLTTVYTASVGTVGIADQGSMVGPVPDAGTEIYFTMNGDVVVITIGVNTYPVYSRSVVRFGGKFAPKIGGAGNIKIDLMEGTLIPVKSELTDQDVYNTNGDGGNGLNHPTARASSRIYSRVVDDWFGLFNGSEPARKQVLDLDFVNGTLDVRNPYSPEVSGESKIGSVLTFVNGALAYQRDEQGRVQGAVFGATNRAFIDKSIFNNYAGSFKYLRFEVDFIAPNNQAYLFSFGENTTSDRAMAQVTGDLRPRVTLWVAGQASDLVGSVAWPFVPGRKYTLSYSLDCVEGTARMWAPDNAVRGNINSAGIANVSPDTLSKLKLGYLSAGTFGGDVVISRIRVFFGN